MGSNRQTYFFTDEENSFITLTPGRLLALLQLCQDLLHVLLCQVFVVIIVNLEAIVFLRCFVREALLKGKA